MKSSKTKSARTIVLATGAGGYSAATVLLAVQLAARTRRRLRGLFVEDEDLLQLTGLPFTREISLTTAQERPLDVERMQRSMRAAASEFRLALEREAGTLKVGWSFDTVRGRLRDVGLAQRAEADMLIFEPQRQLERTPAGQRKRRVLLVGDGDTNLLPALEAVLRGFESEPVELSLFGLSATSIRRSLGELKGQKIGEVQIRESGAASLEELVATTPQAYDCAILPHPGDSQQLKRLYEVLHCPLVLVG